MVRPDHPWQPYLVRGDHLWQEKLPQMVRGDQFLGDHRWHDRLSVTLKPFVLAPILTNTYRQDAFLFTGGNTIFSSEGTTQGDPLAMAMYAFGTLPLITQLQGIVKQCWYADDSAAGGDILSLKRWWDLLLLLGPRYGYFPNGAKSWLVVKEGVENTAREVFHDSDIHVTTDGHCYLGGVI